MATFVTGDLHGKSYIDKLRQFNQHFGKELSRNDTVIILGDFCLPWNNPVSQLDTSLLNEINDFPWTTAFIDGNHENFDVLDNLPITNRYENPTHQIMPNVIHLLRGYMYQIDNHKFLAMGGAPSLNKAMLQQSKSWWPQEIPNDNEKNRCLQTIQQNPNIDFVITHAPPAKQLNEHALDTESPWKPTAWNYWLQENIADKVSFKKWFYGHMHDDRPWEPKYVPLMHVIYALDNDFGQLWSESNLLDYWYPGDPF